MPWNVSRKKLRVYREFRHGDILNIRRCMKYIFTFCLPCIVLSWSFFSWSLTFSDQFLLRPYPSCQSRYCFSTAFPKPLSAVSHILDVVNESLIPPSETWCWTPQRLALCWWAIQFQHHLNPEPSWLQGICHCLQCFHHSIGNSSNASFLKHFYGNYIL